MIAITKVVVDAFAYVDATWPEWADVELDVLVSADSVYAQVASAWTFDMRDKCPTCGQCWDGRRLHGRELVGF